MKFGSYHTVARRGILLLDLLVYMAVLALVLVLAAVVFNRALSESANLQRNITDIERAMKAGERWRADIRAASGPVRRESLEGREALVIPQKGGEVIYRIGEKEVRRGTNLALAGIKSAQMVEEKREHAAGWKWEVELEQRRKEARIKPLFTFMAVPGSF